MTLAARTELTNAIGRRHSVVTGAAKRRILDEFIAATGYHDPTVKKTQTRPPFRLSSRCTRPSYIPIPRIAVPGEEANREGLSS
jgi:hypothetical protein